MNLLYLLDVGLQSSLLLLVAWVVMKIARQPVTRLYVAWLAMGGLALLVMLSLLPHWPRQTWLMRTTVVKAPAETPLVLAVEAPAVPLDLPSLPDALELEARSAEPIPLIPSEPSANATVVLPKPVAATFDLTLLPFTIWAGAALLSLGWIWLGAWQTWRVVRQAKPAPQWLQAKLHEVWEELGRGPLPQLKISRRLNVASALGMFFPVILLPESQVTPALQAKLPAALRHEGAHIRQGDLWLLGLERLLLPLFCLHPLFWLVRREIRLNQELLADAVAAGDQPVAYAEALLAWAKSVEPKTALHIPLAGLSMWKNPHTLTRRVTMLLKNDRPTRTSTSWLLRATVGSLLFTLVLTLSLATLRTRLLLAAPPEGNNSLAPIDPDADRLGEPLVPSVKTVAPVQDPNLVPPPKRSESTVESKESHPQQAIVLEVQVFEIDQTRFVPVDELLNWEKSVQNGSREGNLSIFGIKQEKYDALSEKLRSTKAVQALASPKLVVTSGKTATVEIGNSLAGTIIQEVDNGVELRQTTLGRDLGGVGFVPGLKMSFKPHIISEGAKPYCLLDLNAERIQVSSAVEKGAPVDGFSRVLVHRMHVSSRVGFGQYIGVLEPPIPTTEGKAGEGKNLTTSHLILIKPELVVDGKPVVEPPAANLSLPPLPELPVASAFTPPSAQLTRRPEGDPVRIASPPLPEANLELQIKLLRLDVEEAEIDAEFAEVSLQQTQKAYDQGTLGQSELTQKKLLAAKAKLALKRAQTNLEGLLERKKNSDSWQQSSATLR